MAVEKYSIGGSVQETEAVEAFADIPQNRVLLAEKLTIDPPIRPEIVEGLTGIEQVFNHFKPRVEIRLETEEGTVREETLGFQTLSDFSVKGITAQSNFLAELTMKREQYQKIIRQLKTNKMLKQALTDQQTKSSVINALRVLIQELEEAR